MEPCPGCGWPRAASAVICTNCGTKRDGKQLKTKTGVVSHPSDMLKDARRAERAAENRKYIGRALAITAVAAGIWLACAAGTKPMGNYNAGVVVLLVYTLILQIRLYIEAGDYGGPSSYFFARYMLFFRFAVAGLLYGLLVSESIRVKIWIFCLMGAWVIQLTCFGVDPR